MYLTKAERKYKVQFINCLPTTTISTTTTTTTNSNQFISEV